MLNKVFSVILSLAILIMISRQLWSRRSQLNFVVKIYFKNGILAYFRALLIFFVTITTGVII